MKLCQYNDGPSILLEEKPSRKSIAAWELEDVLKSQLTEPDVEIVTRTDPHLVDATRPSVPIETITGIWEDTLCDPTLQVAVWEAVDTTNDNNGSNANECDCPEVHSEWTRVSLNSESKTNDRGTNEASVASDSLSVKWVDVRNAQDLSLTTPAGCCHFLRGLLGTSHGAMPWKSNDGEELPSMVALVLSNQAANVLSKFRTGDACPSYFLHSVSQLQLPSTSATWWSERTDQVNGNASETTKDTEQVNGNSLDATEDATLLVYKTIPPREHISLEYPLEKKTAAEESSLPDGCLWERYVKHHDDDDDDEEIKDENFPLEEVEEEEDCRALCPPYISHTQDYPGLLEPLLEHLLTLVQEASTIPRWTAWPERQHYRSSSANGGDDDVASWTVFPLCHCFPANIVENRKWIDVTCEFVPQTVSLLKKTLGNTLRTALFSRLDPETTLEAHTGWQDLANHVIRVHIPLVVPNGGLCGTWVDGCVETHQEGRPLCFDDAKVHRAFNYSKQERVVLILDLARPSYLPLGYATGGHTEELDSFINSLT